MIQADILRQLLQAGFISGQELSEHLGISRTAIWKHIEQLRADGYQIESVPRRGYRLIASPDRLSGEAITLLRSNSSFNTDVIHFDQIDSTNRAAKQLAVQGAPEGTLVVAEIQTGGKGRLGREWSSPAGGIWMSMVLRPVLEPSRASRLTILSAVAVADAVHRQTGLQTQIKWPNDVLVDGRKICGILTELSAEMDQISWVVVGIGLNANLRSDELPAELLVKATTLQHELGKPINRNALVAAILDRFAEGYQALTEERWMDVLDQWRSKSITLGSIVQVTATNETIIGMARSIDSDGALVVETESGMRRILAGDVTLRRT